tara:strand:+ start:512 stop:682 length:171 start_codon:yes stop_codon:yes gene_type:complete
MDYFQEAANWFTEAEHLFFKDETQAKQLFCSAMKNLTLGMGEIKTLLEKKASQDNN